MDKKTLQVITNLVDKVKTIADDDVTVKVEGNTLDTLDTVWGAKLEQKESLFNKIRA